MYTIVLVYFLLILFTSVCAGMLGAMAGLGGGILIVPFLTVLLNVNIDYAIGASIIAVIATSSGSAYAYVKEKVSNIRIGTFLVLFTVPGAIIGAVIEGFSRPQYLFLVFGLVLFICIFAIYKRFKEEENLVPVAVDDKLADKLKLHSKYYDPRLKKEIKYKVHHVKEGSLVMFFAGIISGLLGIGSGALNVLAMDLFMKLPIKVSTTTSNFMIGITAAASASIYFLRGDVDPFIAAPVAIGILIGAIGGARILLKIKGNTVRVIFLAILFVMGVEMIIKGIGGL
ncbi:MAG: sulfite exporter TauE/SafE family protein [Thermoplasmatales archaeon]